MHIVPLAGLKRQNAAKFKEIGFITVNIQNYLLLHNGCEMDVNLYIKEKLATSIVE